MGTLRLIRGRALAAAPNLVSVVAVVFLLTHILPGDPAAYFAGPSATAASVEETRHRLGLDHILPEQFLIYVGGLARGDLGQSLISGQPVLSEASTRRLPATCRCCARFSANWRCRS